MKKVQSENRNWILTAKALGWIWTAVALTAFCIIYHYERSTGSYVFVIGFNLSISLFWLLGIHRNNLTLLTISLVYSGIQTFYFVIMVSVGAWHGYNQYVDLKILLERNVRAVTIGGTATVLVVINFTLTVLCYMKMKKTSKY